jgi:hypothetical protein
MEAITMSEETKAGGLSGTIPSFVTQEQYDRFETVLAQWQAAANLQHYQINNYIFPADRVRGHFGAKYARLDIGGSGAFMVDLATGVVYNIMGYGKVDKKKVSGNIYDPNFAGASLVRDRFRYGRFENNSDGSLRQPIVRR